MFISKYGVARHIYIPIVKRAVVDFALNADWTPAAGDVKISKDGGAAANVTNLPAAITMGNTAIWDFSLTATEMQAAQIVVTVSDSATKAVEDQSFIIQTHGHASGQFQVDLADSVRAGLTALPNATAGANGGVPLGVDASGRVDVLKINGTSQTARDIGASVLLSSGSGAGQLDFTSGVVKANLAQILGTALTETAGQIAAAFKQFFDVGTPTGTMKAITNVVTTTTATNVTTVNGLAANVITAASINADAITAAKIADGAIDAATFAAGAINAAAIAADAITDAKVAADVTIASVTGAVGSVTGAVGSVTGAVGSVTGNVGGNVVGSVASVTAGVTLAASAVQAIWDALTSALTTVGSIGKLLVDNVNATISSRLATASYTAPLDAAGTRTAVGLASANLDTQLTTIDDFLDTEIAAIKAKTDNLPAAPAAVSDIPTANTNADALLDRAAGIETGFTLRQTMRLMASVILGKLSGAGTATEVFRDLPDTKDRVTATVDASGNRTVVTKDAT